MVKKKYEGPENRGGYDRRGTCKDCNKSVWNWVLKLFIGQLVVGVMAFLLWGWAAYASSETDSRQNVAIAVNKTNDFHIFEHLKKQTTRIDKLVVLVGEGNELRKRTNELLEKKNGEK